MITSTVGKIGDKELKFNQCMTYTEAKEQKLPDGLTFFWEYGGARLHAGEVMTLIQEAVLSGKMDLQQLVSPASTQNYYNAIIDFQKKSIAGKMAEVKAEFQEFGLPVDGLDRTADMIKNLKTVPGMDGMVRTPRVDQENLNVKIAAKRLRQAEANMDSMMSKNKRK